MKVIKQKVELLNHNEEIAKRNKDLIEFAGRTCYKSEMNEKTQFGFLQKLVRSGHESVIEHVNISFLITTNRAISHEIVRHRIASYSQESTRYCNYSKDKFSNELTYILPDYIENGLKFIDKNYLKYDNFSNLELISTAETFLDSDDELKKEFAERYLKWIQLMNINEYEYLKMTKNNITAEKARGILPNDLKTELVVTMNLRQWRHFIALRSSKAAHPQIREIANQINDILKKYYPEIFFDN